MNKIKFIDTLPEEYQRPLNSILYTHRNMGIYQIGPGNILLTILMFLVLATCVTQTKTYVKDLIKINIPSLKEK